LKGNGKGKNRMVSDSKVIIRGNYSLSAYDDDFTRHDCVRGIARQKNNTVAGA